jgi:hypothetical protein
MKISTFLKFWKTICWEFRFGKHRGEHFESFEIKWSFGEKSYFLEFLHQIMKKLKIYSMKEKRKK